MKTADWDSFDIDREEIEVVASFTFLGSEVEKEGRCDKEIKQRVVIGKAVYCNNQKGADEKGEFKRAPIKKASKRTGADNKGAQS